MEWSSVITTDPSAVQRSEWEAWVLQHPEGTVFHSPGMYETYLDTSNWEPVLLLALNEADKLNGVLLAVHSEGARADKGATVFKVDYLRRSGCG